MLRMLVDIIAFSAAFTIIFTSICRCKKAVSLQVFTAALLIESAFVIFGLQMFSLLPIVTVEAFLIYRQDKKLYFSFFSSLLTVVLLTIVVIITAIPLTAYLPQGKLYDYLMSLIIILYSLLGRQLIKRYFPRRVIQNNTLLIVINAIGAVIMVFISIIAPLFLLYSKDTLPFYILFSVFLVFTVVFSVYAMKAETEKNRREYNRHIEKQYKEIGNFRHYYSKLYRSMRYYIVKKDMEGIAVFFQQYITPEHIGQIENGIDYEMLALVKLPLVNGLLYDTATSLRQKNIPLNLHIEGSIATENIKELDLFKILTNFIDNAVQETEMQEKGYINIFLSENEKGTNIRIENTLKSDINISLIYGLGYTTKESHAGTGLPQVQRIADGYRNVSLSTYKQFNLFIQNITIE